MERCKGWSIKISHIPMKSRGNLFREETNYAVCFKSHCHTLRQCTTGYTEVLHCNCIVSAVMRIREIKSGKSAGCKKTDTLNTTIFPMVAFRPVQTMEHILRHSLMRQPRTWCSLVWIISKHAMNMFRGRAVLPWTNQKLSVFRTNTKAFLATEC